MNKYLMMGAAAALAGTASTTANASNSFTFGTAYGGSYCDGGTVLQQTSIWTWAHTNNNCAGGTSYGLGLVGKSRACTYPPTGAEFKCAVMSDSYFCQNHGLCSWTLTYLLPKKIKAGQPWVLLLDSSGSSGTIVAGWGLLKKASPNSKAKNSTVSKLKELIAVHRNSQQQMEKAP